MRAHIDYRYFSPRGRGTVTLTMPLSEFREHVEWLEQIDRDDGCTKDWRSELDRVDPPQSNEALEGK